MEKEKEFITVSISINAPLSAVWEKWTTPSDIIKWNHASPDWHTPKAENDLKVGGAFSYRMEAKDGSFGFDFGGIYDVVNPQTLIEYTLGDNRKVVITFEEDKNQVLITETFEAENQNPIELQEKGWLSILHSFKSYVEG